MWLTFTGKSLLLICLLYNSEMSLGLHFMLPFGVWIRQSGGNFIGLFKNFTTIQKPQWPQFMLAPLMQYRNWKYNWNGYMGIPQCWSLPWVPKRGGLTEKGDLAEACYAFNILSCSCDTVKAKARDAVEVVLLPWQTFWEFRNFSQSKSE